MIPSGLLLEFDSPERLVAAARALRAIGLSALDAHAPYPIHGLEEALGLERSQLPRYVFPLGLLGAAGSYGVMWWCNAVDYRLNVGARPAHAPLAFVPITFETTVLLAGIGAFVLVMLLSKLPQLTAPEFSVEGFERASVDRFFLSVDGRDPAFDRARIEQAARTIPLIRVLSLGAAQ